MSRAGWSILCFGAYLGVLGAALGLAPNALLGLVGVPLTQEPWLRLAGMLLVFMGFFYVQAARHGFVPFYRWTLVTRLAALPVVLGLVYSGLVGPVIVSFWLGDLAGVVWTWLALRADAIGTTRAAVQSHHGD